MKNGNGQLQHPLILQSILGKDISLLLRLMHRIVSSNAFIQCTLDSDVCRTCLITYRLACCSSCVASVALCEWFVLARRWFGIGIEHATGIADSSHTDTHVVFLLRRGVPSAKWRFCIPEEQATGNDFHFTAGAQAQVRTAQEYAPVGGITENGCIAHGRSRSTGG